jgi:NAD(P)-dependent dehydrogenase (short-subunit alcohol dehydrogenase family)
MDVHGKVAVVTGGAGPGTGSAITRRFASEGARVVFADIDDERGSPLAKELSDARYLHVDMRDEREVRALFDQTQQIFGNVAVLVNNASGPYRPDEPYDHWLESIGVDVLGMLSATRLAIESMRRAGGGAIVNVGSTSSLPHGLARVGSPIYDVGKTVAIRMATAFAPLLERERIRINCIIPHWIGTPEILDYIETIPASERESHGIPNVLPPPSAIAGTIFRLATDETLNGRLVVYDGDGTAALIDWGDEGYRRKRRF